MNTPTSAGTPVGPVTGAANGVVDFDPTTGTFTGGDFNVSYNGTTYNFASLYYSEKYDTVDYAVFTVDDNGTDNVAFQISVPTGFTAGDVCSAADSSGCIQTGNSPHYYNTSLNSLDDNTGNLTGLLEIASSGTLVPTPEPSSLALLGTGLLGAVGIARRKFTV